MTLLRIWTDERGNPSAARVLLTGTLLYTFRVIEAHVGGVGIDNAVWTLLYGIIGFFVIWSAGPRLAAYLVPGMQTGLSALGTALKRPKDKPWGVSTERFDKDVD